jgi:two-component system response regulator DesR
MIETERPNIAVLDLNLPDLFTLEVVRRVKQASLPTKMVVLSTRRDRKTVVESLRCGVNAFLLKSAPRCSCWSLRPDHGRRNLRFATTGAE